MGEKTPPVEVGGWVEAVRSIRRSTALQNSKSLQQLLDTVPGMVYRCRNDRSWTMEYISQWCSRLTGWGTDRFLSGDITLGDLIEPADRESVWNDVQAAVGKREPFELFYRIHTIDGDLRWVWDRGNGVFDQDGNLEGLEGFIQDVTDQMDLRRSLFRMQRFDAVGRSVGQTVHEFNNLFTGMIGFIDLLQMKRPDDKDLAQQLGKVRSLAERAMKVNQDLRRSVKNRTSGKKELDVTELLAEVGSLIQQQRPSNVRVSVDNRADRVWVQADPAELEQVLVNLSTNALEAMPDGGELVFRLSCPAGENGHPSCCCIEIRDTGKGIVPSQIEQVSKPFFSTKGQSGMGLTIADAAIRDSGGRIEIESQPGQGTVLRVFLPAVALADVYPEFDPDLLLR